jgi:hypothetical protein
MHASHRGLGRAGGVVDGAGLCGLATFHAGVMGRPSLASVDVRKPAVYRQGKTGNYLRRPRPVSSTSSREVKAEQQSAIDAADRDVGRRQECTRMTRFSATATGRDPLAVTLGLTLGLTKRR